MSFITQFSKRGRCMNEAMSSIRYNFRILFGIAAFLTLIGLVFIYSSSSVYAAEKCGSSLYFLERQLIFLMCGAVGFILFARTPRKVLGRLSPLFFGGTLFLMLLTTFTSAGVRMHGSARWLTLFGFSFQPSEFLKLFLIMYLGFLFERKQESMTSLLHTYVPLLLILGVSFAILLRQPDFGTVITLFATAVMLFFLAGIRTSHLAWTLAGALPVVLYMVLFKAYRLNRILIFLNPWSDPQGRGYQIIQSMIAIGSGGLWGLGIGYSKQKYFYLPMQHTDFIFSIIAEEIGLVGSGVIVLLFAAFLYCGVRVALGLQDDAFAFYTSIGFVFLLSLQAVINFMVVSGLVPTKGLGLPFISYGGTALIASWCMLGFIANCVRSTKHT
jgi:cell division protein FtsW